MPESKQAKEKREYEQAEKERKIQEQAEKKAKEQAEIQSMWASFPK